ncbi:ATP synthase subunit O, mitochondrial [Leucoraja erinacea]|uniref:ATP synthase subunit O, mitochondrial n=1 Tax=Leucoraja erinaceus TaxID=7782 RepID=UPI0024562178|nr:ATP synthase subunit O, mitochondrial [Leucoraja erinacea]
MTTDLMLFPTFCVLILASYQVQLSSFAITIPTASNKWIYLSGEEKTGQKHCVHKLAQKGIRLQETPGQASPPLNPGFCSPNPECSRFPCSNSPTARLQLPESTGATAHPQKPPRPWVDLHQAKKMAAPARLCLKVRCFSTSVVNPVNKLVMPPIQVYGVEGRYATALYSAASKQKKLDQVEQELQKINSLLKDPKFSGLLVNPHIKRSIKQKAVNDVLTKQKVSPIMINFMNVLAENGRLRKTPDVVGAFSKIMSAHRGEVLCSVTTAQPLDEAGLTDLKAALNGFLKKSETLKLETKTDPSILGGMIVSIGDKYADMSTKTKIQKLSKLINEAI